MISKVPADLMGAGLLQQVLPRPGGGQVQQVLPKSTGDQAQQVLPKPGGDQLQELPKQPVLPLPHQVQQPEKGAEMLLPAQVPMQGAVNPQPLPPVATTEEPKPEVGPLRVKGPTQVPQQRPQPWIATSNPVQALVVTTEMPHGEEQQAVVVLPDEVGRQVAPPAKGGLPREVVKEFLPETIPIKGGGAAPNAKVVLPGDEYPEDADYNGLAPSPWGAKDVSGSRPTRLPAGDPGELTPDGTKRTQGSQPPSKPAHLVAPASYSPLWSLTVDSPFTVALSELLEPLFTPEVQYPYEGIWPGAAYDAPPSWPGPAQPLPQAMMAPKWQQRPDFPPVYDELALQGGVPKGHATAWKAIQDLLNPGIGGAPGDPYSLLLNNPDEFRLPESRNPFRTRPAAGSGPGRQPSWPSWPPMVAPAGGGGGEQAKRQQQPRAPGVVPIKRGKQAPEGAAGLPSARKPEPAHGPPGHEGQQVVAEGTGADDNAEVCDTVSSALAPMRGTDFRWEDCM